VRRGGQVVYLGIFATAEEAALCVARTPEGQAAGRRAAAPPQPRGSEENGHVKAPSRSRAVLKEEGAVPPMPAGAFVKEEFPPLPPGAFVKEEVVVKQEVMVKREHEDVVDEGGPKRRRNA